MGFKISKAIKGLGSAVTGAIGGFMVGGPVGAVIGGAAGLASGMRTAEMQDSANKSMRDAELAIQSGISQAVAMEQLFSDTQKLKLADAYKLTKEQVEKRLREDPKFITEAYDKLKGELDPTITERYNETIDDLKDLLTTGTQEQISALNQGFQNANKQMTESDRLLLSSFDASKETLDSGIQRLQQKYGDISGILAGVSKDAQGAISEASTIAKQAYDSGAVQAAATLGKGSTEAINALKSGGTAAVDALTQGRQQIQTTSTGGLREALNVGQPYGTQGAAGLQAFANTALDPNSQLFQRNLGIAQEKLNQQLASRGLLNSGAAVEAQSNLVQDMAMKEAERQTGLQQTLAQMGLNQATNQQGLISQNTQNQINALANEANLRAQLEANLGQNIANVAQGTAQGQAQLQSNLANQLGQLAQMSGEQKAQLIQSLGLSQAQFNAQDAQSVAQMDQILAQNILQNGVARGEISNQMATNMLNQGIAQGNVIGTLNQNLANISQQAATNTLNTDMANQATRLGIAQEGLRGALTSRDALQNTLQGMPMAQYQDEYNLARQALDAQNNLTMASKNAQANALQAGAAMNMQQAQNAQSNFNQFMGAMGGLAGTSAGQNLIGKANTGFRNFFNPQPTQSTNLGFVGTAAQNQVAPMTYSGPANQNFNTYGPVNQPSTTVQNLPSMGFGTTPTPYFPQNIPLEYAPKEPEVQNSSPMMYQGPANAPQPYGPVNQPQQTQPQQRLDIEIMPRTTYNPYNAGNQIQRRSLVQGFRDYYRR